MFPIKDTIRSRSFPAVTWLLILVNAAVFLFEINLSPRGLNAFVQMYALVPARLDLANPLTWWPLLTHMFLHGGWLHIISNMWTLFIFGDNVEDRLGSFRFLIFYLLGGVLAGLAQALLTPGSTVPALGASGAIAAVLGAYFFFFPHSRVITFVPLFFLPWFVEIPAVIYLGFWFVSQLFSGVTSLAVAGGMAMGGVAWWAHIGGFVVGLILARPFAAGRRVRPFYLDEYYPW
ncbi:MAG TPA: rhomboid family intramembrane serine protease [Anaerolinea thermolimosa]|uniref:Rhomboid family intramembrane serine protease n=1 Tax=Anaerolinea thermolimosa TaxID=229919 RepID=A0A3D1JET3_9CHLR|nr:rhomboid family intramembrane serine protease [Anaerolinea thermolimosa]